MWTGAQAKERGLVDTLGGLNAAVQSAALRAKLVALPSPTASAASLTAAPFRVVYVDRAPGRVERLLEAFGGAAIHAVVAPWVAQFDLRLVPVGMPASVVDSLRHDLGWLVDLGDTRKPFSAVTHCLCSAP